MLLLQPTQLQSIKTHAAETYPHECCGLMLGHVNVTPDTTTLQSTRTVVELWPMTNAWDDAAQTAMAEVQAIAPDHSPESPQTLTTKRRYWIDPTDMLAAQKYARTNGLSIIGIYHSHPDHPAVPSECDRACAWPEYSYIIVSVPNGQSTDVLSWSLDNEHQFQSEVLSLTPKGS